MDELSERRPYNAVSDFVDANVARGLGGKAAFIDPERTLTYGELQARSTRFAHALRALGIEPEHRVALLLNDTVDYPVAFWGTIRAGSVAIPLNIYLNVPQYAYILADCRARALVIEAELLPVIAPVLEKLPRRPVVIVVGKGPSRLGTQSARLSEIAGTSPAMTAQSHQFETIIAAADSKPFTADTLSDEVAFWLYTSGSTGDPKGVRHVHSSLMATAKLFGQGILGIAENDVVHSASKLFFAYGLGNAMSFPLSVGATAALWPHRPSPEGVFETLRRNRADDLLRRAVALHGAPRAQGYRQGRGLRSPAHLRIGGRGNAGAYRPALARGDRRRRARRARLDRDAADVPVEPARRHPLRLDRQAGAGLRDAHRRRARPRAGRRRGRRTDRARAFRRRRLLEPAREKPAAPSRANGFIPATSTGAMPRAITITAAAPTTCSRFQACGCRPSMSRPRSSRMRRCSRPLSSARKMPTG